MPFDLDEYFNDLKKKEYYVVEVELYEELELRGRVPFHIKVQGGWMYCTLLASSQEAAEEIVFNYLGGL
jgi:hypothetical protein